LTDLIAQTKAKDSKLGADLDRAFKVLSSRLPFGLNFERHSPEAVELPLCSIRKGDKVRVLDLTSPDVRKGIAAATSAESLFAGALASDY
jgi:hypothetical protein